MILAKKQIILGMGIVIILSQVLYFIFCYQAEIQEIQNNELEGKQIATRIKQLESERHALTTAEEELEFMQMHKQAILSQLPVYTSSSKYSAELLRYMQINDFLSVSYHKIVLDHPEVQEGIRQDQYELSFVGRYEEVIDFIDYLNQSYQVMCVEHLILDNTVQDLNNSENNVYASYYGKDFSKIIKATLIVSFYSRIEETEATHEIYQPSLELQGEKESVFKRAGQEMNLAIVETQTTDVFLFSIGDPMASGDTYQFKGPSLDETGYLGMVSDTSVELILEIQEDYYVVQLQDSKGQRKEIMQKITLEIPEMQILSAGLQELEIKPSIKVHIQNHTNQIFKVQLVGTQDEQIEVISGESQPLTVGETAGNVSLIA